ncbi:ribonuclease H-like domain-containing protein [Tanacetum coccineum]
MVTRFRVRTNRPTERLNLHVSLVFPLSKSSRDAFSDPNWQNAMRDEYHALIKNKTWTLVPRPPDTNIVQCTWLFRHKYLADGTLSRYKAHLLANGSTQLEGVDVDEAFSPVVKPASSESLLQQIIRSLHQEFAITDLGPLNYILGISVTREFFRIVIIFRRNLPLIFVDKAHMDNCNPSLTPIDTEFKLGSDGDPKTSITSALKWILRYVRGILDYGLQLFSSSTIDLFTYSDADWAGCHTTRRSTSGYCIFLGNNILSWSSNHEPMLSRSSAKAEYRGVANVVAETCWLRNLLRELHTPHLPLRLSNVIMLVQFTYLAIWFSINLKPENPYLKTAKPKPQDPHGAVYTFIESAIADAVRGVACETASVNVDSDNVKVLSVSEAWMSYILKTPFTYHDQSWEGSMSRVHAWNEVIDRVKRNRLCPKCKIKLVDGGFVKGSFTVTMVLLEDTLNLMGMGLGESREIFLLRSVKTDSLPTRFNVSRRGIDIDSIMCVICDNGV